MSVLPVPVTVNAGDISDNILYLLSDNIMYTYSMDDNDAPNIGYTFIETYDFRAKNESNPFSGSFPSSLPQCHVTAMTFTLDYSLLIFCERKLYIFHDSTEEWTYEGEIATPCI